MEETTKPLIQSGTPHIEIWDNAGRAKNLKIVFWLLILVTFFAVLSGYFELELLTSIQEGYYILDGEAEANDLRQGIIGITQTILYIISIVVFLNWFRRAYGNLHRLYGRHYLKHKESMALWFWFIPILWFFRPVQIMNEIWKETQHRIKHYDPAYLIKSGGLIIGLWWTLFILSNFIGRYVFKTTWNAETLEEFIQSAEATFFSDIMNIPEALLVILIVTQLSHFESRLKEEVIKTGGTIVYK